MHMPRVMAGLPPASCDAVASARSCQLGSLVAGKVLMRSDM